jgi:hypothetical protein
LTRLSEVADFFAGIGFKNQRARWDGNETVFAFSAGAITAAAVFAALSAMHRVVAKIYKGIHIFGGYQIYAATIAAVAPIGAAEGNVFFTAERGFAIAAIASFYANFCFVNESHVLSV